jgi:hypothetical protein
MTQDDVYRLQYLAGIIDKQGDTIKPTDESNISIVGSAKGNICVSMMFSLAPTNGLNYGSVDQN